MATQVAKLNDAIVTGVCSGKNKNFVLECGASTVLDYKEGDIIEKIEVEATENGKFHMILDCVNSADARDSKACYRDRILEIRDRILVDPNLHNYVVLGGTPFEWIKAAIKRVTPFNFFSKSFELFWIKMTNSTPALNLLKEMVDQNGLKPKVEQELDWSEDNVALAFEALRSRRTTGKIVLKM